MSDHASRFSVEGKRALVTGGSKGIGAEIATVLADAGADVGIVGRDAEGLDATRQAVVSKGRRCIAIQADLQTVEGPRTAGAHGPRVFRHRRHPRQQRRRLSSPKHPRNHGRELGRNSGGQPAGSLLCWRRRSSLE